MTRPAASVEMNAKTSAQFAGMGRGVGTLPGDAMSSETLAAPPPTISAAARGERLYPARSSRSYWHLTTLRESYLTMIREHLQGLGEYTLVDYGCGNMPYRSLFQPGRYIGCDFPGNEQADVLLASDGTLPLLDEYGDVVLSSQVLEHVSDPDRYLAEAHRVLKPGGLLFLSTHGVWRYHPDPVDLWRWTCDGLQRVTNRAGFQTVAFRGAMGPEATVLQLWQDAVASRVPERLRRWFVLYMQWKIRRADQRCNDEVRNRDASVYVLVARNCSGYTPNLQ